MKCPSCGKDDWHRVEKKVKGNKFITYTGNKVVIHKCRGCGYEMSSPAV